MAWLSTYAARSVGRNLRRTSLSVVGIAIGCVLAVFMESLNRGRGELFARAGSASGVGHIRVVPAAWPARRDVRLRLADWQADLAAARSLPGVVAATGRARAQALLAVGTHVVPVEIAGVQPYVEPQTFRYVQSIKTGGTAAGETGALVLGRALAERLSAEVDDGCRDDGRASRRHSERALPSGEIASTGADESDTPSVR